MLQMNTDARQLSLYTYKNKEPSFSPVQQLILQWLPIRTRINFAL